MLCMCCAPTETHLKKHACQASRKQTRGNIFWDHLGPNLAWFISSAAVVWRSKTKGQTYKGDMCFCLPAWSVGGNWSGSLLPRSLTKYVQRKMELGMAAALLVFHVLIPSNPSISNILIASGGFPVRVRTAKMVRSHSKWQQQSVECWGAWPRWYNRSSFIGIRNWSYSRRGKQDSVDLPNSPSHCFDERLTLDWCMLNKPCRPFEHQSDHGALLLLEHCQKNNNQMQLFYASLKL